MADGDHFTAAVSTPAAGVNSRVALATSQQASPGVSSRLVGKAADRPTTSMNATVMGVMWNVGGCHKRMVWSGDVSPLCPAFD